MNASTPSEATTMTAGQKKKLGDLMTSMADHVTNLAATKIKASPAKWQDAFAKMDDLRNSYADFVLGKLQEMTFCLLKRLPETVSTPASEEFTITEELLKREYNIWWFGDNFRRLCFGKQCAATKAGTTAFHTLQKNSLDPPIMAELGDNVKTPLGHVLHRIKQQSKGQKGSLLVNGNWNVAYVELEVAPGKMEVWAVSFCWDAGYGCWDIGANPVSDPRGWNAGGQFLSSELS